MVVPVKKFGVCQTCALFAQIERINLMFAFEPALKVWRNALHDGIAHKQYLLARMQQHNLFAILCGRIGADAVSGCLFGVVSVLGIGVVVL